MDQPELLKIRPPQTGNGAGLAQSWLDAGLFYNQLAPDLFQVPEQNGLAGWFEEGLLKIKPDELYLVAEYSGQAIGFIEVVIEAPLGDSAWQFIRDLSYPRLYINALVIQQAYWRHGIGKQLLLAAEKWGQNRGAHIALLDTFIESPISVSFYEQRMGYQRRSIRFQKLFS